MTQVGGFGNYSQNQFLFLSGSGSNLRKENNQNIEHPNSGINIETNDDITEFSMNASTNLVDTADDTIVFTEKTFLKNNPFAELIEDDDTVTSSFSKMFSNIISVFSKKSDQQIIPPTDENTLENINLEENEEDRETVQITSDNFEE